MKDVLVPAMFITAQRQLWSENLRVAEGNPFTSLPLGFTVGCLVQGIDFSHFLSGPKITYWFTLLTVVSWKLNHGDLHCHTKCTAAACCCCGSRCSCCCWCDSKTTNANLEKKWKNKKKYMKKNLKKSKNKYRTPWCRCHVYLIKEKLKSAVRFWLKNQTLMWVEYTSNVFIFRDSVSPKLWRKALQRPLFVLFRHRNTSFKHGAPNTLATAKRANGWPSMITAAQLHVQWFVLVHLQSQRQNTNSAQCQNLTLLPPSVRKSCAFPVMLSK